MLRTKIAGIVVAVVMGMSTAGNINAEAAGGTSPEQAVDMQINTPFSGTLSTEGSSEWYTFKAGPLDSYYVFQTNCSSNTGVEFAIYSDINKQDESFGMVVGGKGSLSRTVKLNPNQTYYICMTNEEEKVNGQYTLTIKEVRDDVGDTAKEARWTVHDKVTTGTLEAMGDKDVYKFKTGRKDVPLRAVFQNLTSGSQLNFTIYRASGLKDSQIVARGQNVRTGASRYYEVMLKKNTIYYVVVDGGNSGNYQFYFENMYAKLAKAKTKVKASKVGKKALLSWNRMDYVHAYEVHVSTKKNGGYRLLSTVSSRYITSTTSSTLKKGTYYFKVCGVATVDIAGTGDRETIRTAYSAPKKVVIK